MKRSCFCTVSTFGTSFVMICVTSMFLAIVGSTHAQEPGYLEEFALSKDRQETVDTLIPGTNEHFYYWCLHLLNEGELDKAQEVLGNWIKQHGKNGQSAVMQKLGNRLLLLNTESDPKATVDKLRNLLNLTYNYRNPSNPPTQYPSTLSQSVISDETLTKRFLTAHPNDVGQFEPLALPRLFSATLTRNQRENLLAQVRPNQSIAELPKMLVDSAAGLNYKGPLSARHVNAWNTLTLAQLDEIRQLRPNVLNETQYVQYYLQRLQASTELDWQNDKKDRRAYLNRIWRFISQLAPVHNAMRASVLEQFLLLDQSEGKYNRELFTQYIRLPIAKFSYVNRKYIDGIDQRFWVRGPAKPFLNQLFPTTIDHSKLISDYLQHFATEDEDVQPWVAYLNDVYVRQQYAESRLINGIGDPQRWYAALSPTQLKQLRDRVELLFAKTNPSEFAPDADVTLKVSTKNIDSLLIKVYEINALNYYRSNSREIRQDINLDGLVSNVQRTVTYDDAPVRRVKRVFEFPEIKKPGSYVIDLIGNGINSRVIIHKGRFRYVHRNTTAGHLFTVIGDDNRVVKDCSIWLGNNEYESSENGSVVIPYTNLPSSQSIIITKGNRASIHPFSHASENYTLKVGMHVDAEQLLLYRKADLLILPRLFVNGQPTNIDMLENVKLSIDATTVDGVDTRMLIDDLKLDANEAYKHTISVPPRLLSLTLTLSAQVEQLSTGTKVHVSQYREFDVNGQATTNTIEGLHLGRNSNGWFIDIRGRTGEPLPSRYLYMQLKHVHYRPYIDAALQSDENGRIHLGALNGIDHISVPEMGTTAARYWQLTGDQFTYPSHILAAEGERIRLPHVSGAAQAMQATLLRVVGSAHVPVSNHSENIQLADNALSIKALEPGNYNLIINQGGQAGSQPVIIPITVARGDASSTHVVSKFSIRPKSNNKRINIKSVDVGDEAVTIQLTNANNTARVHVIATRYRPMYGAFTPFAFLHYHRHGGDYYRQTKSTYLEGRDIGDEYRYILSRQQGELYPGNLLTRPSLLINPWTVNSTTTSIQEASDQELFEQKVEADMKASENAPAPGQMHGGEEDVQYSLPQLDFLDSGSLVLANLIPDENGKITFDRSLLDAYNTLQVVGTDLYNTISRRVTVDAADAFQRDLRMSASLDAETGFAQQQDVTIMAKGDEHVISDPGATRFTYISNVSDLITTLQTIRSDPKFAEFEFLGQWHELDEDAKKEKYSEKACHELNFFLYQKDNDFFTANVLPSIANKKEKQFMDLFLLGDDLTSYLDPIRYGSLNSVEQVLLGLSIEAERDITERRIRESVILNPTSAGYVSGLFQTALSRGSLSSETAAVTAGLRGAMGGGGMGGSFGGVAMGEPSVSSRFSNQLGVQQDNSRDFYMRKEAEQAQSLKRLDKSMNGLKAEKKQLAGNIDGTVAALGRSSLEADANGRELQEQLKAKTRQLFRQVDKTMEYAESNYYQIRNAHVTADLVAPNQFWLDYAQHDQNLPFLSEHILIASSNFTEVLLAAAVMDLPFESEELSIKQDDDKITLSSDSATLLFHESILPVDRDDSNSSILINENFYQLGQQTTVVDGEEVENYITKEFLPQTVYVGQVVVTNTFARQQRVNVLTQIPTGAIPLKLEKYTQNHNLTLEAFQSQVVSYSFYFPMSGKFAHYPAQMAKDQTGIASAKPLTFNVVDELIDVDTKSWKYIATNGSNEDVLRFLNTNNLTELDITLIAYRLKDKGFWKQVVSLLDKHHQYREIVWKFALMHYDANRIKQYLPHTGWANTVGQPSLDSPLLHIDPVLDGFYEHLEYMPLVNARTHKLGPTRKILNDRLFTQYSRLLHLVSFQSEIDDTTALTLSYYLMLQDRVGEALAMFEQVDRGQVELKMQYDYFKCYALFYQRQPQEAKQLAENYEGHAITRWNNMFAQVVLQAEEIEGNTATIIDDDSREQNQQQLADAQPTIQLDIVGENAELEWNNLDEVTVNYYLMDLELLFSRNPFVKQNSDAFSFIRPNQSAVVKLAKKQSSMQIAIPKEFLNKNVLVEVTGKGVNASAAYYATSMRVQLIQQYGQLRVTDQDKGAPIDTVYVKVYAQTKNGKVKFYKDGYTDLRGRFDYATLSTNELDNVRRFSILVYSDENGAEVHEAEPPKQ
ncbi:MAG: hypothetical protein ACJZ8O_10325 [Pirellulaceae bacterium]